MTTTPYKFKAENSDTFTSYMDSIGCVYTVQLLLELESVPDRKTILNSIDMITKRYPIIKCRLVPSFWQDSWIENKNYSPDELLDEEIINDERICYYKEFIKRASEKLTPKDNFPLKIIVYRKTSNCLLVIKMHHSLSDGNGCLQFASEFGKMLYDDSSGGNSIKMNRNFGQLIRSFSLKEYPALFKEALKENVRPLAIPFLKPIIGVENQTIDTKSQSWVEQLNIKECEYDFIKSIANSHGITINDYLLCSFLKTSMDVRNKFNRKSYLSGALFTIDLRRYQKSKQITLANFSSAGTCIIKNKNLMSFSSTVKIVGKASKSIKFNYPGIGFMWIGILSDFFRLPSGINRLLASIWIKAIKAFTCRCFVFSNVGLMDNFLTPFGNRIINASFLGPFSNLNLPTFWISGYNKSLTININQIFSNENDNKLQRFITERLKYNLLEWPKIKS